jgi:hypothetical protein
MGVKVHAVLVSLSPLFYKETLGFGPSMKLGMLHEKLE